MLYKILLFCLIFFSSFACNEASIQPATAKTPDSSLIDTIIPTGITSNIPDTITDTAFVFGNIEEKIFDTIFKLPEIKERSEYIEKQTKEKRHLKVWIASEPDSGTQNYYWFKAGEDNGTNLVTHFNFYVYPDSLRIMYYDTVLDSLLTLEEWRKSSNNIR